MIKTIMQWCTTQFAKGSLQYNRVPDGLKITDRTGASMVLTINQEKDIIFELLPDEIMKPIAIWRGWHWVNLPYTLGIKVDNKEYAESAPIYLESNEIYVLQNLVMKHLPMSNMKNDLMCKLGHGLILFGSNHCSKCKKEKTDYVELNGLRQNKT